MRPSFLILIALACAAPLAAEEPSSSHVKADLSSDVSAIRPGAPFWFSVRLSMDPGWHTYWKNPGDSGLPTKFEWTLPEGFSADEVLWPVPKRFGAHPTLSYGYEKDAVFLCRIVPPETLKAKTVPFRVRVRWMECAEICVPGESTVSIQLPVSIARKAQSPDPYASARRKIPAPAKELSAHSWATKHRIVLGFQMPDAKSVKSAYFYPEARDLIDHSAEQKLLIKNGVPSLQMERSSASLKLPEELKGVLVILTASSEKAVAVQTPLGTEE